MLQETGRPRLRTTGITGVLGESQEAAVWVEHLNGAHRKVDFPSFFGTAVKRGLRCFLKRLEYFSMPVYLEESLFLLKPISKVPSVKLQIPRSISVSE